MCMQFEDLPEEWSMDKGKQQAQWDQGGSLGHDGTWAEIEVVSFCWRKMQESQQAGAESLSPICCNWTEHKKPAG